MWRVTISTETRIIHSKDHVEYKVMKHRQGAKFMFLYRDRVTTANDLQFVCMQVLASTP